MDFHSFCNICFNKEDIIELHMEESKNILNIMIALVGYPTIIDEKELCICKSCCDRILDFNNFKNMLFKNFIHLRLLYNELKHNLEFNNDPDIKRKLSDLLEASTESEKLHRKKVWRNLISLKNNVENFREVIEVKSTELSGHYESGLNTHNNNNNKYATITPNIFKEKDKSEEENVDEYMEININEHEKERIVEFDDNYEEDSPVPIFQEFFYEDDDNCGVCEKNVSSLEISSEDNVCVTGEPENSCSSKTTELNEVRSDASNTFNLYDRETSNIRGWDKDLLAYTEPCPHICVECRKSFSRKGYLRRHMLSHAIVKPHKCNICGKGFTIPRNLRKHVLRHSVEQSYKCPECGKTYVQNGNYKRHLLTHTGEKPFKCGYCNRAFTHSNNLKTHERVHKETVQ